MRCTTSWETEAERILPRQQATQRIPPPRQPAHLLLQPQPRPVPPMRPARQSLAPLGKRRSCTYVKLESQIPFRTFSRYDSCLVPIRNLSFPSQNMNCVLKKVDFRSEFIKLLDLHCKRRPAWYRYKVITTSQLCLNLKKIL